MVNKPFWHIGDFVLALYTFGYVKISDFVPNIRHLRKLMIFIFHSKKRRLKRIENSKKFTKILL